MEQVYSVYLFNIIVVANSVVEVDRRFRKPGCFVVEFADAVDNTAVVAVGIVGQAVDRLAE